jgi:Transglutaminase family, C-terminal ig like domain
MRQVGLLAFGVTSLLLVPVVVHEITAGPQQVAKLIAPGSSSLAIGNARIDATVDRAIADAGDVVRVKLRATAPKVGKVTASVLVLEQLGTYNGRVEQPPDRVLLETLTLDAAPEGGAPKEVAVRLLGKHGLGELRLGHYTILVLPPKTAAKLDQLRRGARREGAQRGWDPMASPSPRHGAFDDLYYGLMSDETEAATEAATEDADGTEVGAAGRVARLDVMTRSPASAVAIRAPEQGVVGQELSVVVQVTNPTKQRVEDLTVQLQQPPFSENYRGMSFEQIDMDEVTATLALGPRETQQVTFKLTPKQAGTLGLYASISCSECEYDERLTDGNIEAIDIVESPKPEAPKPAAAPVAAAAR